MPFCLRRRNVGLAFLVLFIFIIIELWSINDLHQNQTKYDARHRKLLQDYQSKRMKKSSHVIINPPLDNPLKELMKARRPSTRSPQLNQHLVNSSNAPIKGDITTTIITDLFIAVKSSGKFHNDRLPLLLDTWIPFARQSTFLITDVYDDKLSSQFERGHYHKSACLSSHYRRGLVCKVSVAYDLFMHNPRRWFCIADDDTYINIPNMVALLGEYDSTKDYYIGRPSLKYPIKVTIENSKQTFWFHTGGAGYCISHGLALKMSPYAMGGRLRELAERIRVPDDVAVGYIINKKLGVSITNIPTFHSHLEGLWRINPQDLKNQITLSYGVFESGPNKTVANVVRTGGVIPTYPPSSDPTRLRSVHCYLFPHARECLKFGIPSL